MAAIRSVHGKTASVSKSTTTEYTNYSHGAPQVRWPKKKTRDGKLYFLSNMLLKMHAVSIRCPRRKNVPSPEQPRPHQETKYLARCFTILLVMYQLSHCQSLPILDVMNSSIFSNIGHSTSTSIAPTIRMIRCLTASNFYLKDKKAMVNLCKGVENAKNVRGVEDCLLGAGVLDPTSG